MSLPIIDTHQHLWELDRFPYSWTSGDPVLGRSFRMPDYLAAIEGLNIVGSVHVEADVDAPYRLRETAWLAGLAKEANPLRGLVASATPDSDAFAGELEILASIPAVKGVRRVLHTPSSPSPRDPRLVENIRRLAKYDLSFDLCVSAAQLPEAISLVEAAPAVRFVLDHCGVPDVKGRALDPWRDRMRAMAALPNVVCKVSGVVAYADRERWAPADLAPFIWHTIDCFGWDRVLFGSDWPVCTLSASLKQWVEALREVIAGASEEQQRQLFHDNAVRVYRLDA
jgi:predicted TIM-barrel fold metal-dependent hydrolase